MNKSNRIITQAHGIIDRTPDKIRYSSTGLFGGYYVKVDPYRVYFNMAPQANTLIAGSERIIRLRKHKWYRNVMRKISWLGSVVFAWILFPVLLVLDRRTRRHTKVHLEKKLNRIKNVWFQNMFTRARPQHVLIAVILIFMFFLKIDFYGIDKKMSAYVPRVLMSVLLNIPKEAIKEEDNGWYAVDATRITAVDKKHESLKIRGNPMKWFVMDDDAIIIERERIGSDGRDYGAREIRVQKKHDNVLLHKDERRFSFKMKKDYSIEYDIEDETKIFIQHQDDLVTDKARVGHISGEKIKVTESGIIIEDI